MRRESFDHDFVLQNIVMHAPSIDRGRSLHPNHDKIHQIMIGKRDNNPAKISRSSNQILQAPKDRRVHCDPTKDRSDANAQYIFSIVTALISAAVNRLLVAFLVAKPSKASLSICVATIFASTLMLALQPEIDLAAEKNDGWNGHHQPRVSHHRQTHHPFAWQ